MDVQQLGSMVDAVARRVTAEPSTEEALALVADTARDTIPGADHVTISLARRGGRTETLAATDELVREIDAVQYELGEGPCIDAVHQRERRVSHDLAHEDRWPRFAPWAVGVGVRSQMGLDLFDDGVSIGGLNVYAHAPHAFSEASQAVAMLFGAEASHADRAFEFLARVSQQSDVRLATVAAELVEQTAVQGSR